MGGTTLQIIAFASFVLIVAQYGEGRTVPRDNGPAPGGGFQVLRRETFIPWIRQWTLRFRE
jgi:hypothetical protein